MQVVASSLDRLQSVLLTNFADKEDLVTCLKASANVPKIAGDPVVHRGERLVDAAVFEAVPWRAAIADGCTHVVVLCTRPASRWGCTAGGDCLAWCNASAQVFGRSNLGARALQSPASA